jgi:hypothetical protein
MAGVIAIAAIVIVAIFEHSRNFIAKYSKPIMVFLNYCWPTAVIIIIDSNLLFNNFIFAEAIADGNY